LDGNVRGWKDRGGSWNSESGDERRRERIFIKKKAGKTPANKRRLRRKYERKKKSI